MIKKRKKMALDPDVTAYADIAFLLIIFFILTTSFSTPLGRLIDMPSAAKPPENQKEEDKTPLVSILGDRILFGDMGKDGREITTAELRLELAKYAFHARPEQKDRMVAVEVVSDDVTYQRYFEIVSMVAASGGVVAMVQENK